MPRIPLRAAAAGLLLMLCNTAAPAATLRISCGAVGQELDLCSSAAQDWARRSGHQVEVVATPADASERLRLYQRLLAQRSEQIDVLQIDVIWPGLLAPHLLDLRPHSRGAEQAHFGGIVASNTVGGRLLAMPWFTDAGLLYYRRDLLAKYAMKPPRTWVELAQTAQVIQTAERAAGNAAMWGYTWQGRAYEGLACNALEWMASHGNGALVDTGGRLRVNTPAATQALATAAGWVGSISPPGVLDFAEEESRALFHEGNAVFMRNWPYAWALAQAPDSPVKGKVGIAVLPRGPGADGRSASALGGQQLAVSKYSKAPAAAAELVMYLTSAEVQKERALKGSFNPTRWSLYADREIVKANPFMGELYGVFASAVGRPAGVTGMHYESFSRAYVAAVHEVLKGRDSAATALPRLEEQLLKLGRNGRWD
jgi:trehalose/maltose transport system substrate-binding protein